MLNDVLDGTQNMIKNRVLEPLSLGEIIDVVDEDFNQLPGIEINLVSSKSQNRFIYCLVFIFVILALSYFTVLSHPIISCIVSVFIYIVSSV